MSDERMDAWLERMREEYNPPPATPRDEMWAVIEAGLRQEGEVVSLAEVRRARWLARRPLAWGAAAAAVLILGIGIGRITAPAARVQPPVALDARGSATPQDGVMRAATMDHFGRSESLLTAVRADARMGRMDPGVARWARGLLTETRLLMDASEEGDPAVRDLLEDLELVLVQIVGAADSGDASRDQSEVMLALEGLEQRDVLSRIQAILPAGPGFAGT